jgi:hypothetical protein
MRSLIREDLSRGMSEQQVIAYFHQQYGDQILETPPTSGFTLLIWLGPLLVLLFGAAILVGVVRDSRRGLAVAGTLAESGEASEAPTVGGDAADLSPEERDRYQALLLAEMDELEGYTSPRIQPGRRSQKGGAAI